MSDPVLVFNKTVQLIYIGSMHFHFFSGNFFPVTMSYVSEICQKERRSILVSSGYVCGTIGLSLNYILNSISWRLIAVLMLVICLSAFLQLFLIPESNYWYLLTGKLDKAKASILWFEPTLTDQQLNQRIENILQANEEFKTEHKGQFAELIGNLGQKKFYKPLLLGMLINIVRSGDGRLVIGIYIETIIKDINTPYDTPTLIRLFGWADIIGSFMILLFVHKIKRKTLIFASSMTLVVSLGFVVAYKFSQQLGNPLPHWLPVVSLYIYAMCVVTAYHSVISIIISEIQVPSVRPQMTSLQNGIGLIFYCFYTFIFPYVEKVIPIQYIFLFPMFNITTTMIVILILVPETSKLEFYENEKKTLELSADKNKNDEMKT